MSTSQAPLRNLREALHDDLATLRALNSELRLLDGDSATRTALLQQKAWCMQSLRGTLSALHARYSRRTSVRRKAARR